MPRLIVSEGPNMGRLYEFRDECTMGRSLEASVRLPDSAVSRKHARIIKKVRGYFLQDLQSGNGTFLNGALIRSDALLKSADKIRVGHVVMEFFLDEERAADAATRPGGTVQIVDSGGKTTSTILKQIDVRPKAAAVQMGRTTSAAALAQAHDRLRMVLSISNSLQRILNLDQLLQRIVSDLFSVFPQTERALIFLRDEQTGELSGRVAQTRDGTRLEKVEVSRTIIGEVVRTRTAVLSADAMGDSRFMSGASVHNLKVRSMMCVPLVSEEEVNGAIYVDTTRSGQRFMDDDLDLLTGISSQAALAVQNAMMHERLMVRQRAERDLQLAHKVQKGFLPEFPPQIPGYEFAAWYSAAQIVGGDFYDFIDLPNNRLGVVVGDVCGKGIPAALLMAKLMSEVRYVALAESNPADAVALLNENFGRRPADGRFVTLVYLVLDPAARRIESVSAGHPNPLVQRRSSETLGKISVSDNFPLGLKSSVTFESAVTELGPGDTMVLFTDGVTEAMNASGELYGAERLEKVLRSGGAPPSQLMAKILNDIDGHVGTMAQTDDLTLVCFGPAAGGKNPNGPRR